MLRHFVPSNDELLLILYSYVVSNLQELEKTLWDKKTKEALTQSLSWTFGSGLKELWSSLKKLFGSSSSNSTDWKYKKNQITNWLEKYEERRTKKRSTSIS